MPFVPPTRPNTRSPGLHLSQLIREIERDVYGDEARPDGPIPPGFAEMGFIWEGLAEQMVVRNIGPVLSQFESYEDRIYATSDWVPLIDGRVWDAKLSYKSTSSIGQWESRFLSYMIQLKWHCRYFETNEATLLFMFVMGDWKRGDDWSGPSAPRRFDFTFTDDELEANRAWVLRYRDEWEKRGGPRPYRAGAKTRAVKVADAVGEFTFT